MNRGLDGRPKNPFAKLLRKRYLTTYFEDTMRFR
jgi:hypothetical protein